MTSLPVRLPGFNWFFGALEGIVIGVILSVMGLLKNMYNPDVVILGRRDSIRKTRLEQEIVDPTICLSIEDCIEKWEAQNKE